jgi:membrane-associated protein
LDFIQQLLWYLTPEGITYLIQTFGMVGICVIIFAETGIFALLPGDSLLVLAGIFAASVDPTTGQALLPLWALLMVVPVCGILGDQVGYWIGSWLGRRMYEWRDIRFLGIPIFKKTYLERTEDFYRRWGRFTIVAGRWVPIVRTFAPIVAGIVKMPFRAFIAFNVIGAVTWVWSMVWLGYLLKVGLQAAINRFVPGFDLVRHIDKIAIVVILLSLLPIVFTVWKERKERAGAPAGEPSAAP